MSNYYYGTVPSLAWIFGHYYYNGTHYTWVASEFYPYRLPNPKSSSPILIYQDLYQPWRDKDEFDKFILQVRINIKKAVIIQERKRNITSTDANSMKNICDNVDIHFFYPLVFRIDINDVRNKGRTITTAGSGITAGSLEYLIEDLKTGDFEILFLDDDSDPDFKNIVYDRYYTGKTLGKIDVSRILSTRC